MTDYKSLVKAYRAYLIALAAVILAALMALWYFRGYGGNIRVNEKITEITASANINQCRAQNIIDAAKQKEEETAHETTEKISAVSDDDLPDLLAGLLADWRKQQSGR